MNGLSYGVIRRKDICSTQRTQLWAGLTGSAQIAYLFLRVLLGLPELSVRNGESRAPLPAHGVWNASGNSPSPQSLKTTSLWASIEVQGKSQRQDLWVAVVSHRLCQDPGKRNADRPDNEELLQETFQNGSKCEADGCNLVRPEIRKNVGGWVGG